MYFIFIYLPWICCISTIYECVAYISYEEWLITSLLQEYYVLLHISVKFLQFPRWSKEINFFAHSEMIKEEQFMNKRFWRTNLFFKNNMKKSSPFQITSIIPLLLIHLPLSRLIVHPSISIFLGHNSNNFSFASFIFSRLT